MTKLLFPDTDSLTNEIETKDFCLLEKKNRFDNSGYPENSKLTDEKGICEFKDEAAVEIITEFIGLRSKMYSYIKDNSKTAINKIVIN